jgi:hydrogenase maturation factor HypE
MEETKKDMSVEEHNEINKQISDIINKLKHYDSDSAKKAISTLVMTVRNISNIYIEGYDVKPVEQHNKS